MSEDLELLNFVYQNAKMGTSSIDHLLPAIQDKKFESLVLEQRKDYEKICKRVEKYLKKEKKKPEDLDLMAKVNSYIAVKMDTARDDHISHLAEMLIKGSNMGIIQIKKHMNQYSRVEKEVMAIANELLEREEKNLEELKPYL